MGGPGTSISPSRAKIPWSRNLSSRGSASCTASGTSRPNVRSGRRRPSTPTVGSPTGAWRWPTGPTSHGRRAVGAEAARHKSGLTEREQMYIDALSNEAGYRAIIAKFPRDLEAKAFEVGGSGTRTKSITPPPAELGEPAWPANILSVAPTHPIHHAVLHIADVTQLAGGRARFAAQMRSSPLDRPHVAHADASVLRHWPAGRKRPGAWRPRSAPNTPA